MKLCYNLSGQESQCVVPRDYAVKERIDHAKFIVTEVHKKVYHKEVVDK